MKEFWVSSGHHLTRRQDDGSLAVTDEVLLALYARPEVLPPEDACVAENALHQALMQAPRRVVTEAEIATLADADARENWTFLIAFRDTLIAAGSIEAAWRTIVETKMNVPPLFLNQLIHLILRNMLDGCEDTLELRAAELFFRAQKISLHEGRILLADQELIEELEADSHASPLIAMMGQDKIKEIDVLSSDNAFDYWSRSDAFAMALDFARSESRDAFARVVEKFIRHIHGERVNVTPIAEIKDEDWRWFVGLDQEGTALGNILWKGVTPSLDQASRALAFFTLRFKDETRVNPNVKGHPVYLLMGMSKDRVLRIKPQNLLMGLPLAKATEAA
ncbi:hypothetical protein KIH24_05970 [Rhizobiales bacterium TNE-4]|nr:hypothetical protein [Rhizobiales bacterium TNE-4]MBV1827171.1 hypothetical protein [Rhizobiales bacterium TNE-4]